MISTSSATASWKPPCSVGSRLTSAATSISLSFTLSAMLRLTWMTAFSKQAA
ncbi:MAG: hypothetical protein Q27BB25_18835 [Blastomonas sp. CACIA14H2]|nr:MAG: hypothetical protein Q27BB25_18835 [Blastomonas sp. CACIA14H2]